MWNTRWEPHRGRGAPGVAVSLGCTVRPVEAGCLGGQAVCERAVLCCELETAFRGSSVRMLGLVAHTCNSSTLKTEEDCKFEAFVGYHGKCQASQPVKKKKKKDF